jgi:hypothetical protein
VVGFGADGSRGGVSDSVHDPCGSEVQRQCQSGFVPTTPERGGAYCDRRWRSIRALCCDFLLFARATASIISESQFGSFLSYRRRKFVRSQHYKGKRRQFGIRRLNGSHHSFPLLRRRALLWDCSIKGAIDFLDILTGVLTAWYSHGEGVLGVVEARTYPIKAFIQCNEFLNNMSLWRTFTSVVRREPPPQLLVRIEFVGGRTVIKSRRRRMSTGSTLTWQVVSLFDNLIQTKHVEWR